MISLQCHDAPSGVFTHHERLRLIACVKLGCRGVVKTIHLEAAVGTTIPTSIQLFPGYHLTGIILKARSTEIKKHFRFHSHGSAYWTQLPCRVWQNNPLPCTRFPLVSSSLRGYNRDRLYRHGHPKGTPFSLGGGPPTPFGAVLESTTLRTVSKIGLATVHVRNVLHGNGQAVAAPGS